MRRLLQRNEAPPQDGDGHSYRFTFPEDGFVAWGSAYNDWRDKIREHAEGNGLPVPDMSVCEDQLCGTLPPDKCKYEIGDPPPVVAGFEFGDVVNWIKAVAKKVVTGAEYASQEEADRRAAICVRCPLNTQAMGGCGACAQTAAALTPGMMKRSTQFDDKLKNCGICKCYLRVMVHYPISVLEPAERPDWCWAKVA